MTAHCERSHVAGDNSHITKSQRSAPSVAPAERMPFFSRQRDKLSDQQAVEICSAVDPISLAG